MKSIYNKLTVILVLLFAGNVLAQSDATLYGMRFAPQRATLNPAFAPKQFMYFGISGMGSYGNSSFALRDMYNVVGDSMLKPDPHKLLKALNKRNTISLNAQGGVYLGFKIAKLYFHFSAVEKVQTRFTMPKDLFSMLVLGNNADELAGKKLEIGKFELNAVHYREYALATSYRVNCDLTFGLRYKYLYGMENIRTKKMNVSFETSGDFFDITTTGNIEVNTSGIGNETDSIRSNHMNQYLFGLKNSGHGFDFGVDYKLSEKLRVNASIIDLGYIRWKSDTRTFKGKTEDAKFVFSGVDIKKFNDSTDYGSEILDTLESIYEIQEVANQPYSTVLNPKIYLGASYEIIKGTTLGGLAFFEFSNGRPRTQLYASATQRIGKSMEVQVNAGYANRSIANVGAGVLFNAGPINIFLLSDNILAPIMPTRARNAHFRIGINIALGSYRKDSKDPCSPDYNKDAKSKNDQDGDGIKDKKDRCPTQAGPKFLEGCPDTDKDSIADIDDKCPSEFGLRVFGGCPDTDGDGVPDKEDECPETKGLVQYAGCPDTDGDGIDDGQDACPTVPGKPEFKGCPDTDGDGIQDSEDECPEVAGKAEFKGCPDTDGDGTADKNDGCPNEAGTKAMNGCPDRDNDMVADKDDACPDVPGLVSMKGCPAPDTDGDGVTDSLDQCPKTPGLPELNGCPKIEEKEQEILNTAFSNLEFETNKAVIRSSSFASLDSLAALLIKKPDFKLVLSGHTDNQGSAQSNMTLSKNRTLAVVNYLVSKGVSKDRITAEWFGSTKPIDDNTTEQGRQRNRRVEMKVKFD